MRKDIKRSENTILKASSLLSGKSLNSNTVKPFVKRTSDSDDMIVVQPSSNRPDTGQENQEANDLSKESKTYPKNIKIKSVTFSISSFGFVSRLFLDYGKKRDTDANQFHWQIRPKSCETWKKSKNKQKT